MNDLESFIPSESSEGVDAGALERMREQMKKASAAMVRDQKQEQKQKKKEDDLFEVLLTFINQLGVAHPLVKLVVKCLEQNILADVILLVIALNYPSLQKGVNLKLLDETPSDDTANLKAIIQMPSFSNDTLPILTQKNIEIWIATIQKKLFEKPQRNLSSLQYINMATQAKSPNPHFVDLINYILQEYLTNNSINFQNDSVLNFMHTMSASFLKNLENHINNTAELEEGESSQ